MHFSFTYWPFLFYFLLYFMYIYILFHVYGCCAYIYIYIHIMYIHDMCVHCTHREMYITHIQCLPRQKKSISLDHELQIVVIHHVCAENQTHVFWKSSQHSEALSPSSTLILDDCLVLQSFWSLWFWCTAQVPSFAHWRCPFCRLFFHLGGHWLVELKLLHSM